MGLTCLRSKGAQLSQLSPSRREGKAPLAPLEAFRLAETFKLGPFFEKSGKKDPPSVCPFSCGAPASSSVEVRLGCEKREQKATRISGEVSCRPALPWTRSNIFGQFWQLATFQLPSTYRTKHACQTKKSPPPAQGVGSELKKGQL